MNGQSRDAVSTTPAKTRNLHTSVQLNPGYTCKPLQIHPTHCSENQKMLLLCLIFLPTPESINDWCQQTPKKSIKSSHSSHSLCDMQMCRSQEWSLLTPVVIHFRSQTKTLPLTGPWMGHATHRVIHVIINLLLAPRLPRFS